MSHEARTTWHLCIRTNCNILNKIGEKSLLFVSFSLSIVSKAFGERIVVDFELSYSLVLVSSDSNELCFFEHKPYKSVLVLDVVGELELVKRHIFGHPLFASGRRVRMYVHSLGHLGVRFASHHPFRVVKLVAAIVGRYHIHQQYVLGPFVQTAHFHLERRKHASRGKKKQKKNFFFYSQNVFQSTFQIL
ncbi:hypothetical protein BpHYR1_045478 [Brachionus plicatilis]|uniref:Uncharacterized protein n=1 Tax=Brachionus plicatilis TaxID=10195 RepID=A0A3M7Q5I2_BRAPC|nr:hypothetical protein BpHYR1_045478 [Brachionus plicatilis]